MRASGRLSPLTGLVGVRQAEQYSAGEIPMRGGFNITPIDGEWWSRSGRPVLESRTGDNPAVISQLGNIQWSGILSTNHRDYIWSQSYVLEINSEGLVNQAYWESDVITGTFVSATSTEPALPWFFYPNNAGYQIYAGDLLLTGTRGEYGQCYRVLADVENPGDSGSRLAYLDRYWSSPTGVEGEEIVTVRVIPSLHSTWTAGTGSGPTVVHAAPPIGPVLTEGTAAGATTFDQLVTFDDDTSAGSLPPSESVTSFFGRRTYMVITAKTLERPVAILLDDSAYDPDDPAPQAGARDLAVPRQYWYRNTAVSFTEDDDLIPHPYFCCASNGRLIIGRAQDHQGGYPSRTIWYSGRGNLTVWHTGVQNETSAPNYVTFDQSVGLNDIRGLLPLGNRFVVHRRHSQMVASYTGSNEAPFAITENSQDIGLEAYGAVVLAAGAHFFPTDAGPAAFDGQSVTPLGGEIRPHLAAMGFWFGEPFAVGHDRERKLIYFLTSHIRHQDVIPSPPGPIYGGEAEPPAPVPPENRVRYVTPGTLAIFYSAAPALVYSMDRQSWFFEDQPSLGALGQVREGGTWGIRLDGTVLNMKDGAVPELGLDAAVDCTTQYEFSVTSLSRILIPAAPVDAFVESPWVSFGTLERKMITKILLQLRAWPATDVYDSEQDIMHGCTLEILTNGDATVVRETIQVSYKVEDMRALSLDENRQQPLMSFELSPRVSGENFKFIFRNALPEGSTHKKGPMRIANFEVFYDQGESNRPLTSMGKQ